MGSGPRRQLLILNPKRGLNLEKSLNDFTTLTFDCYGTLIDWETGIWDAYQPLLMANRCATVDRQSALVKHAGLESSLQMESPEMLYPHLLAQVHNEFSREFGLHSTGELDRSFGDSRYCRCTSSAETPV
jgi:FMN phosphatase YigB (HAD superfamily)